MALLSFALSLGIVSMALASASPSNTSASPAHGSVLERTSEQDVNVSLQAESADACSTGLIGMAMSKYPETRTCMAPCHSSCPTLNAIMTAFMMQGGQPAAIRTACQHRGGLTCLFNHVDPCGGFVAKASGLGMTIPTSETELNSMCSSRRLRGGIAVDNTTNRTETELLNVSPLPEPIVVPPVPVPAVVPGTVVPLPPVQLSASSANATNAQDVNISLEAASGDACSTGLIGMAMSKYPEARTCMAPCHSSCSTVNAIMTAYMTQGGQPAAMRTVCGHRSGLTCLFNHVHPCRGLVDKASRFGMTIPTSESQLNSMCR